GRGVGARDRPLRSGASRHRISAGAAVCPHGLLCVPVRRGPRGLYCIIAGLDLRPTGCGRTSYLTDEAKLTDVSITEKVDRKIGRRRKGVAWRYRAGVPSHFCAATASYSGSGPRAMATTPVRETSTSPSGCIRLMKALSFSVEPVSSNTKDSI